MKIVCKKCGNAAFTIAVPKIDYYVTVDGDYPTLDASDDVSTKDNPVRGYCRRCGEECPLDDPGLVDTYRKILE